eukprot:scaffold242012_cov35-Tisochrysis_lutea.AAC.3
MKTGAQNANILLIVAFEILAKIAHVARRVCDGCTLKGAMRYAMVWCMCMCAQWWPRGGSQAF